MDLVSIITPTYNCASFITETIECVRAQTYSNWELIISDDCSTDNTREIVLSYQVNDRRIHYIRNEMQSGAAVTRNNALKTAKGRWIAFLDSDDLWTPHKLQIQIDFMLKNRYAFTYHQYKEIDEASNEIGVLVSGKKHVYKFDMFSCCWPGCLSVMYDASAVGLLQIEDVKKNNDTAMWLKIVKKYNCHLLPQSLGFYRRRKMSVTPPTIRAKIKWHYILFREAEHLNPLLSAFWMCMNIIGNSFKKIFFVKRYCVN